jgi:hypothetical protein
VLEAKRCALLGAVGRVSDQDIPELLRTARPAELREDPELVMAAVVSCCFRR